MIFYYRLIQKNSSTGRIIFGLFFAVSLLTELVHRYHYRAELNFTLSEAEIMCFLLIGLIVFNPKGIRFVLLGVLILLIVLSARNMLLFHSSNVESLPLLRAFSFFGFDQVVLFFMHQVLYLCLIFLLFKEEKRVIKESKRQA